MENWIRQAALQWWRKMTPEKQSEIIQSWKKITSNHKKSWDEVLIKASTSTIEEIYREIEMS